MSLLVVGISHRSAPLELLERASLDGSRARHLAAGVVGLEDVGEALVLTTCNRTEVYVEALSFHGALAQVGGALAAATGVDLPELTEHLYVHYEDRAVDHLFSLACGLESMALGESEILGQLRETLAVGQRTSTVGAALNPLFQQALRVGKRAHSETRLDQVARSLVTAGLGRAEEVLGRLDGVRAVVVGAGAMSGLACASLARAGVASLTVVNRTAERAERLAAAHGGLARDWSELGEQVLAADLVLTCTGATNHVITTDLLTAGAGPGLLTAGAGTEQAEPARGPLVVLDLAMPRDVEPAVGQLPGVTVWGLAELSGSLEAGATDAAAAAVGAPVEGPADGTSSETESVLAAVRDLVTGEVAAYLATRRSEQVAPALAALRSRASAVAEAELERLDQKLPELSPEQRAEVHQGVRRILYKILHRPTVRAKELAAQDHDGSYVALLKELFDLDPRETAAVDRPPRVGGLP